MKREKRTFRHLISDYLSLFCFFLAVLFKNEAIKKTKWVNCLSRLLLWLSVLVLDWSLSHQITWSSVMLNSVLHWWGSSLNKFSSKLMRFFKHHDWSWDIIQWWVLLSRNDETSCLLNCLFWANIWIKLWQCMQPLF